MSDKVFEIALIGVLGVGAQWLAWRTQWPAIVILLAAGFLAGPALGLVDPQETFGDVLQPMVSIAVAIVLFEGGLTLNFAELRETSKPVRRMTLFGAPAAWGLGYLAARYLGGLGAEAAAVISGVMVVTGPTVVMPLLRQAKLPPRPAAFLRWEAIAVDPLGAIFAVVAYEGAVAMSEGHALTETFLRLGGALVFGAVVAFTIARIIALAFTRGWIPEFLKAPILLVAVIAVFKATNLILEEAGLLTVTLLGIALANTRLASLEELRRFKESMTILLVSGLFIILTASTSLESFTAIGWGDVLFLAALLFVIRPIVVGAATIGGQLTWKERLICAWIAPRGVVAIAVSGLFAQLLAEHGFAGAERLTPLALLVVVATVVLHGFSIAPLARALGVADDSPPGLLIVGGSDWSAELGKKLADSGMPVMIADSNWNRLAPARKRGVPTYYGEILSEAAEHRLDLARYGALIAVTDNDAYNALVCTDLAPEIGRSNVFQLAQASPPSSSAGRGAPAAREALHFTVGGRTILTDGPDYFGLMARLRQGWTFSRTKLTDAFTFEDFMTSRNGEVRPLLLIKGGGASPFAPPPPDGKASAGDAVISFGPEPAKERAPKPLEGDGRVETRAEPS